jgi:hypothetical protein
VLLCRSRAWDGAAIQGNSGGAAEIKASCDGGDVQRRGKAQAEQRIDAGGMRNSDAALD